VHVPRWRGGQRLGASGSVIVAVPAAIKLPEGGHRVPPARFPRAGWSGLSFTTSRLARLIVQLTIPIADADEITRGRQRQEPLRTGSRLRSRRGKTSCALGARSALAAMPDCPTNRGTAAMLETAARTVIELICAWLRDDAAQRKLIAGYLQKGGLEGWTQVEIADLLGRSFPSRVRVDREVLYREFAPEGVEKALLADVVLFLTEPTAIAIELKIESIYQEANASSRLAQRYRDDVGKVALLDIRNPNVLFLVCGIAISHEANDAMVRMLRQYPGIGERTHSTVCGRSQEFDITLYWTMFYSPQ